jgi:uncharacterized membrane protein YhaH (DUF805 family)
MVLAPARSLAEAHDDDAADSGDAGDDDSGSWVRRRPARGAQRESLSCAAVAAAAGLFAVVSSQDGTIRASVLVKMSGDEPMSALARASDPHFSFVTDVEHYDGVYYYAIARDPLLLGKAHTLIDQPAYRYGHPLHGWLARIVSLGVNSLIPQALLVLSLAGLALAGWATSRYAVRHDRNPWLGLVVAVVPGLLYAATVSTTETVGAALVVSALLAWEYRRWSLAAALLLLCCLDKEQYVAVPVGLAVWEAVQWRRSGRPRQVRARATALGLGPVALSMWYLYVHARLHEWPSSYQSGNLGTPIAGWQQTMQYAHALSQGTFEQSQIGAVAPPVLAALAVLLLIAAVHASRLRTVADAPYLCLVLITACQGWRTLLYPHEIFRTPAVATLLAVVVLLGGERRPQRPPPRRSQRRSDRPSARGAAAVR